MRARTSGSRFNSPDFRIRGPHCRAGWHPPQRSLPGHSLVIGRMQLDRETAVRPNWDGCGNWGAFQFHVPWGGVGAGRAGGQLYGDWLRKGRHRSDGGDDQPARHGDRRRRRDRLQYRYLLFRRPRQSEPSQRPRLQLLRHRQQRRRCRHPGFDRIGYRREAVQRVAAWQCHLLRIWQCRERRYQEQLRMELSKGRNHR